MQLNSSEYIAKKAAGVLRRTGTSNPDKMAARVGIIIKEYPFKKQKGVYKVIKRNRFIFLKSDLDPVMRGIVIAHEIGHDSLHRTEAAQFQEFNLFDMANNRMEYEANLFAAEILLPEDELLDCIWKGLDAEQTAKAMRSDINLIALKVSELKMRGYKFKEPEYRSEFLRKL